MNLPAAYMTYEQHFICNCNYDCNCDAQCGAKAKAQRLTTKSGERDSNQLEQHICYDCHKVKGHVHLLKTYISFI